MWPLDDEGPLCPGPEPGRTAPAAFFPGIRIVEDGLEEQNRVLPRGPGFIGKEGGICCCLLYTSDAADDLLCVDLGGRRIIKKKNK